MSRRPAWQKIYERFDPQEPARAEERADRPRSPAADILEELDLPFGLPRVLLTGTVGTGKSTELIRVAEERAGADFTVLLDLHRHFSLVVGDEHALRRVSSWEVVFLAGLAVIRAASEVLPYPIPQAQIDALAIAWTKLAKATDTPHATIDIATLAKSMLVLGSAAIPLLGATPSAASTAATGALTVFKAAADSVKWTLPIGRGKKTIADQDAEMQSLLMAVNAIVGYVQTKSRRILLVIDGLDRIDDLEHAKSLFLRSELIAQLGCPVVVCGPFALRSHPAASAVPRFSKITALVNEPVLDHDDPRMPGPGVQFFCDLYDRRVADLGADLVPRPLLERLAYYSGGRARDFVKSIRILAQRAYTADAEQATDALVKKVLDEARHLLETGLDAGHIDVLAAVAKDTLHLLPADGRARDLLSYGQLLPYPNESEWYYPHPLLTMSLVRTSRTGSSG